MGISGPVLLSDDEQNEEDDRILMLELGYGDEAVEDRSMPPTSLVFPNFESKTYQQLQEFI